MKVIRFIFGLILFSAVAGLAWVILFHAEWIKPQSKPEEPDPETDVAVQVAPITRANFHRYLECFGTVQAEQRRVGGSTQSSSARVSAPSARVIAEVRCAVGQHVESGDVLFKLDDRIARAEESKAEAALFLTQATLAKLKSSTRPEQIALAEVTLNKARQALEFAQQNEVRVRSSAKDQLILPKQLEEAAQQMNAARQDQMTAEKQLTLLKNTPTPEELAEAQAKIAEAEKSLAAVRLLQSMLTVHTPLSATVLRVNVNPGETVDATTVLAELVDLQRLEVHAAVPASDMKWLKPGLPVEIRCSAQGAVAPEKNGSVVPDSSDSAGEKHINATLSVIGLQVDPKTDTIAVRVALPADAGLLPGQFARLKIVIAERLNALAVPESCVFRDKTDIDVIAVVENGKSALQNVTPGLRENGLIEISGKEIKAGDTVVTAGAYGLPEETKVHVIGISN